MRIGNQPQPIVVAQQRVRPAEASGLLAKAAPRFQVGRVAAFVQHINNGTFGSADTRAFKSSAKPAAFAGSPMTAGAPVVRAAPATERMPILPPLKSPALVLALTGVVNRGGDGGTSSAPSSPPPMQAGMTSTLKSSVASPVSISETAAVTQPSQAQDVREIREMREMRRTALARPRSTLAATARLQRIAARVPDSARKPAPPERYEGMLRANRSEIHLPSVLARAESAVSPSPDAQTHDGMGGGEGDWDVMSAFEPFKERLERMEVAMHPAVVAACEVAGSSLEAWGADDGVDSDWGDDFDGDSDSGIEEDVDAVDHGLQSDASATDENRTPETPEQRFRREGEEVIGSSLKWARRAKWLESHLPLPPKSEKVAQYLARRTALANEISEAAVRKRAVQQLKLDVLRYGPELQAFDALPRATRMEGVESVEIADGKSVSWQERPAYLDSIESFNRGTLRKVGTAAKASASDVEQSFGGGFAKMLETHKESLLKHSHTASGLENDADADWDS